MPSSLHRRIFSFAMLASVSAAALVVPSAHAAPCVLADINGGRKFVVEAWAVPDARFDVGEPIRIQMRVSTPSFLSLFHVSTSCKVTRLLRNFEMSATEIVDFPSPESGLRIVVKPPAGPEAFYLVSTRNQFDFLSGADIPERRRGRHRQPRPESESVQPPAERCAWPREPRRLERDDALDHGGGALSRADLRRVRKPPPVNGELP